MATVQSQQTSGPSAPSQWAAVGALNGVQSSVENLRMTLENNCNVMVERLRANRDFCRAALAEMPGVTVPNPDGAFYLFPKIGGVEDSFEFCRRLLIETKVGLAPGVAFGAGGEGSVRICYAAERAILKTAMDRLSGFLRRAS